MPPYEVPSDVVTFVTEYIESIEQLEVLLLVASGGEWTAERIARELRGNEASVANWLERLNHSGLAAQVSSGSYTYQPSTPELKRAVAQLDSAYRTARYRVIELIFSKPLDKIRTFSEAFRLKRDK